STFGSLYASGVAFPDGADDGSTSAELAPYLSFSDTLTPPGTADVVPTNTTCATATGPASLPHTPATVATSGAATPNAAVWFSWTATANTTVLLATLGSQYRAEIAVFSDCSFGSADDDTIPAVAVGAGYGFGGAILTAETGTTYTIRVRQRQGTEALSQ